MKAKYYLSEDDILVSIINVLLEGRGGAVLTDWEALNLRKSAASMVNILGLTKPFYFPWKLVL